MINVIHVAHIALEIEDIVDFGFGYDIGDTLIGKHLVEQGFTARVKPASVSLSNRAWENTRPLVMSILAFMLSGYKTRLATKFMLRSNI